MKVHSLLSSTAVALALMGCADSDGSPTLPVDPTTSLAAAAAPLTGPGGVRAGLRAWLRADAGIDVADGASVRRWIDQSVRRNHAIWNPLNAHGELPPVFRAANPDLGGRPTVRFNEQNALDFELSWLAGSDYTILVVNGRDRVGFANFYLAGDSAATNQNLILGYEQPLLLRQAHFNNALDATVEDYMGAPVWSLDTYRFSQGAGKDLYHNGAEVATDNMTSALITNTGTTLGHFRALPAFWFRGDLAEVVVYDRALTGSERIRAENYLAARHGLILAR